MSDKSIEDIVNTLHELTEQMQRLGDAYHELKATRAALTNATALEEQTVSVVRRLNDKWRENTDAVARLHETVENLSAFSINMKKSFDLLYHQLIDIIHCPIPGVERRSLLERRHREEHGGAPESGGSGVQ